MHKIYLLIASIIISHSIDAMHGKAPIAAQQKKIATRHRPNLFVIIPNDDSPSIITTPYRPTETTTQSISSTASALLLEFTHDFPATLEFSSFCPPESSDSSSTSPLLDLDHLSMATRDFEELSPTNASIIARELPKEVSTIATDRENQLVDLAKEIQDAWCHIATTTKCSNNYKKWNTISQVHKDTLKGGIQKARLHKNSPKINAYLLATYKYHDIQDFDELKNTLNKKTK